jgi:hypothetical protein
LTTITEKDKKVTGRFLGIPSDFEDEETHRLSLQALPPNEIDETSAKSRVGTDGNGEQSLIMHLSMDQKYVNDLNTYYRASDFFSDAGGWIALFEPVMTLIEPIFIIRFLIYVAMVVKDRTKKQYKKDVRAAIDRYEPLVTHNLPPFVYKENDSESETDQLEKRYDQITKLNKEQNNQEGHLLMMEEDHELI